MFDVWVREGLHVAFVPLVRAVDIASEVSQASQAAAPGESTNSRIRGRLLAATLREGTLRQHGQITEIVR